MAQTLVTQLETKLLLNDIQDVVVSTIEQDQDGNYVREFRFFGTADDGSTQQLTLTLRALSLTRPALEISTPALQI